MLSLYTTTTTFLEGAHPGGYDTQIRTRPIFLYNAPTPKFNHPVFTRLEVTVLTNPQTNRCRWKHRTLFATLRRWVKLQFNSHWLVPNCQLHHSVCNCCIRPQCQPWISCLNENSGQLRTCGWSECVCLCVTVNKTRQVLAEASHNLESHQKAATTKHDTLQK